MRPDTAADPIAAARAHFPALAQWTYLDVAARCVLPRGTPGGVRRRRAS